MSAIIQWMKRGIRLMSRKERGMLVIDGEEKGVFDNNYAVNDYLSVLAGSGNKRQKYEASYR